MIIIFYLVYLRLPTVSKVLVRKFTFKRVILVVGNILYTFLNKRMFITDETNAYRQKVELISIIQF